ncbi:proteasome assembly chaperone 2 [Manduca sexta]|uniref:proteasome assembly chaperone 2 n=1 Tax=Manduca sexta TaxID=7130 RepID=UPI001182F97D|nr:proteasome assembly chaperone 2 [Manduca sexta]
MAQINTWKYIEEGDLSGFTLIVPSVAVGNVAQLTCDLLISSLKMTKIAKIQSLATIPVLGYDPYDINSNELSCSCELYRSEVRKVLVLQIRAPLVLKHARSFLTEVIETLKTKKIKDVIILTSSYAHEKRHIMTSPFRFKMNDLCPYKNKIKHLNWTEHECLEDELNIFGGGFASLLYKIVSEESVPCLLIYKYCSEGDNIPDAFDMIQQLTYVLPLFSGQKDLLSQLVQPVSWKFLFGRPPPREIY